MRTLLVSALALGAFTSAAFAEPLVLSDVQMDGITAGQTQSNSSEVNVTQTNNNSAPGEVNQSNTSTVTVNQSNTNAPPAPPPA